MLPPRIRGFVSLMVLLLACRGASATDYYAAFGAPPSGPCTDPASPCDLGFLIGGAASGPNARIHVAASPSVYRPQYIGGTTSFTLIGAGASQTLIGGGATPPKCAITLTTGTIAIEDVGLVGSNAGCCGIGVCVNVPDGVTVGLSLKRTSVGPGSDGGRGIDVVTTGSGFASIAIEDSLVGRTGDGGIVFAGTGSIDIDRVLFYNNYRTGYATAPLQVSGSVTTNIRNSTFYANFVDGTVGGVAHASSGLLTLNNVTFSGNAGYAIQANVASIAHTIIDGTCSIGGVLGGGYSVESPGNTCSLSAGTSLVNVSSQALALGTIGDHGGPTQTLVPQAGSVAIGRGGAGCEAVDQRDYVRLSACDAGAVQADSTLPDAIFRGVFELPG